MPKNTENKHKKIDEDSCLDVHIQLGHPSLRDIGKEQFIVSMQELLLPWEGIQHLNQEADKLPVAHVEAIPLFQCPLPSRPLQYALPPS